MTCCSYTDVIWFGQFDNQVFTRNYSKIREKHILCSYVYDKKRNRMSNPVDKQKMSSIESVIQLYMSFIGLSYKPNNNNVGHLALKPPNTLP